MRIELELSYIMKNSKNCLKYTLNYISSVIYRYWIAKLRGSAYFEGEHFKISAKFSPFCRFSKRGRNWYQLLYRQNQNWVNKIENFSIYALTCIVCFCKSSKGGDCCSYNNLIRLFWLICKNIQLLNLTISFSIERYVGSS